MKHILLILIGVTVLCLSGCGSSAQEKQQEKEKVSKKIMGSGMKPIPQFTNKNSLK